MDSIRFDSIHSSTILFFILSICFAIISLLLARILYVLVRSPRRLGTYYYPTTQRSIEKNKETEEYVTE